jgi:HAD superfamily hydrolase (TIGR01484 family)
MVSPVVMRYFALASDYDGTLAHDGRVNEATVQALERLVPSGRKLILVTGRELPDLKTVFPRLDLCERVVAENGALLYNPATQEQRALAQRPSDDFIQALRVRGVSDVSVGEVIIATWRPHEVQVLEAIQELGLELQIIFNKDAVMVLPSGVNKKSGLCAALEELGLSPHNVAGIGDAENDHAFLESCECPIAVANAIPALKTQAALVTAGGAWRRRVRGHYPVARKRFGGRRGNARAQPDCYWLRGRRGGQLTRVWARCSGVRPVRERKVVSRHRIARAHHRAEIPNLPGGSGRRLRESPRFPNVGNREARGIDKRNRTGAGRIESGFDCESRRRSGRRSGPPLFFADCKYSGDSPADRASALDRHRRSSPCFAVRVGARAGGTNR